RCRRQGRIFDLGQGRRHLFGRRPARSRFGQQLRSCRVASHAEAYFPLGSRDRRGSAQDRGRDLYLHQRRHRRRGDLMAIYLSGETAATKPNLDDLTPRQIVAELDKYVVGQNAAKKAVAVALRNRIRRQKLPPEMAEDVLPKNILMIGSTGVGKTEIARRLARLANSPFIKIEASKFTEVGYVGRDVESMVRELADVAVDMAKQSAFEEVQPRAEQNVEEKLLDLLLPTSEHRYQHNGEDTVTADSHDRTREKLREQLRHG